MGKKKSNKKANKKAASKNFLLNSFLALIASIWVFTTLLIAGIEFTTAEKLKATAEKNQADLLGNSIAQQVSHDFSQTQARLSSIASNKSVQSLLHNYAMAKTAGQKQLNTPEATQLANETAASNLKKLNTLALLFKSSFPNADHLHLFPWDHSGTAGIKSQGIKIRNNIESLMIAKAGGKNIPTAEAYQQDKQWFIAFATPIIVDNKSVGVVLLSLNSQFIKNSLDIPAFNQYGKVILKQRNNQTAIMQFGSSSSSQVHQYKIPLSQGEVLVYLNNQINEANTSTIQNIYIIAIIIALILTGIAFTIYVQIKLALKKDIERLQLFASSLSGLHQTKVPHFKLKGLANIAQWIQQQSGKEQASSLTQNDGEDLSQTLANIAKAKAQADPDEVIVELGESFGQELNLDDEAELDLDLDLDLENSLGDLSSTPAVSAAAENFSLPAEIFRDYDIRGHAENQLNDDNVYKIGQAIATETLQAGQNKIVIAMDGRLSGPRIRETLVQGILATGCDIVDIGIAPTPVLYYATHKLETQAGIMITGSHNAPEINGFKIVINGQSLFGEQILKLAERIQQQDFQQGQGSLVEIDVSNDYADEICMDVIAARPIKIVVDAGNGVGGELIVKILQQIDCEVVPIHCEIDGNFPNHAPDPSHKANLVDLIQAVADNHADIGIALDGDADRMVAVSGNGQVIAGDSLLAIFANDVVSRNPAASVVFDVKCSRNLSRSITQIGGRPVMWKSGHSNIKAKMLETSAILGGEYTGHFFFKERWYGFDDGIYAALRLIELLTIDDRTLDDRIAELPVSFSTEELMLAVDEDKEKFSIMLALKSQLSASDGMLTDIDGLRIDFPEGWGLIRASNTSANIAARFEANSEEELQRIRDIFQQALLNIDKKLQLPTA
ncbi:MAG: hypothetical protein HRU20_08095 [Pseudomonadales bacterium]|nr:hypothetical protein [Pseudomonadales bacterium]